MCASPSIAACVARSCRWQQTLVASVDRARQFLDAGDDLLQQWAIECWTYILHPHA
jgi:hypothetical protein